MPLSKIFHLAVDYQAKIPIISLKSVDLRVCFHFLIYTDLEIIEFKHYRVFKRQAAD